MFFVLPAELTSPEESLEPALLPEGETLPTAAVRRARSAREEASANPSCFIFSPGLRQRKRCSSARCSSSSNRRSSHSVRRLLNSEAALQPGGSSDRRSFERPSSSCGYSLLPCAVPCQHCATAASASGSSRRRTTGHFLEASEPVVQSGGSSAGEGRGRREQVRRGVGVQVDHDCVINPLGAMMTSPTAGGLAWVA